MTSNTISIQVGKEKYESVKNHGCQGCVGFNDDRLCGSLAETSPIGCTGVMWVKSETPAVKTDIEIYIERTSARMINAHQHGHELDAAYYADILQFLHEVEYLRKKTYP